jgi:YD repeat-containing protein
MINTDKLKLLLFLIILVFQHETKAQSNPPDIVPPPVLIPSANAAALGKYGDIPVTNYTGVAAVQIPIRTLKYGDLSVDISLSYHGGGVRVEEEASWTGLNWSLNAGGVITRGIRGLDDFPEFGDDFPGFAQSDGLGFFKEGTIPSYVANSAHTQGEYTWVNGWDNMSTSYYNYQRGVHHGDIDGQPDAFNFNFNGRSGKFIIDKKRNASESYHIVLYSQEDLKIELVNNDLTGKQGFKITDDAGVEYWFQQLEISRSRSGVERTGKMLYDRTSIDPNDIPILNRSIVLEYAPNSYFSNSISSWYLTKMVSSDGITQINFTYEMLPVYMRSLPSRSQNNTSYAGHVGDPLYSANYSFTASETRNVYLKRISYPGVTVDFSTTDRLDMLTVNGVSAKKLQSIDLAYEGSIKKNVLFEYSYFNSGSGAADCISKRLKLDGVQFRDGASNNDAKYAFQYYNSDHLILPDKDSYAQDLFGFYNGQRENDSKANFFPLLPAQMMSVLFPGAIGNTSNRDVMPEFVTAGLLRRIYYPTGGSTAFVYESNDYSNGEEVNYYAGNYYLLNGNGGEMLLVPPADVVNDVIVKQGAGCRIKEVANYTADNKVATRKVFTYRDNSISSGKLMFGMKHFRFDNFNVTHLLSSNSLYASPSSAAGSPIGYSEVQEFQYDAQNQQNGRIDYAYENEIESNASLFVLKMTNPNFCSNPSGSTPNHFQYTTDLSTPYIMECSGWSIDPQYSVQGRRDIFSPHIPNVVHASNGNNTDYSVYAISNGNSRLVYRKTNVYQELNEEKIRCIASHTFPGNSADPQINSILFNESSVFKALSQSTVYQDGVTTVTKYTFDPLFRHYKTQSTSITNSKGEDDITSFKYFTDYNSTVTTDQPSIGIKYLQDNHIYAPLEIISTKKKGTNVSVSGASCFQYSGTNGKLQSVHSALLGAPIAQNTFTSSSINGSGIFIKDSRYDLKKSIGSFNALGQPNEITTNGSFTDAFIWDQASSNVQAQTTNAGAADVAHTSFESSEKGRWEYSAAPIADNTSPSGQKVYSLAGGNISKNGLSTSKTYKVSYWSKNGVQTVNGAVATSGRIINGWQYWAHTVVNPAGGVVSVSGNGTIDELRLYPERSLMTTYTYDPLIGMTSQCDANNTFTYYEYDSFGRLTRIRDWEKSILQQFDYHYQSQLISGFWNVAKSGTFTRNNCAAGYAGTEITYTVPFGTYSSDISQADADQKAQNDVNVNGQSYANANASCTFTGVYYNVAKSGIFSRNNCSAGYAGSPVQYTVAANTYTSTISQADADQKAQNDVNANGQAYANSHGTCTPAIVDVNYQNFTTQAFTATYTNTSTGVTYNYTLNANKTTNTALGQIPFGTYNISITHSGPAGSYDISVFNNYQYGVNSLSVSGVNFTCNCGHIEINFHD